MVAGQVGQVVQRLVAVAHKLDHVLTQLRPMVALLALVLILRLATPKLAQSMVVGQLGQVARQLAVAVHNPELAPTQLRPMVASLALVLPVKSVTPKFV